GVELYFLEYFNPNVVRIPAHVIAGEIDEHDVFSVLLLIGGEFTCQFRSFLVVSSPPESTCDGINVRFALADLQLRLRRSAHAFETGFVEIQEVRRRIDRPQSPIDIELITCKTTSEPTRQYDLENITPKAMFLALFYYPEEFLIRVVGFFRAVDPERIRRKTVARDDLFDAIQCGGFARVYRVLEQAKLICKVVGNAHISINLVLNVGDDMLPPGHLYVFKISHTDIGHVAKEGAIDMLDPNFRVRLKRLPE